MRGSWVAGGVRARGLLERTLGAPARAELATRPSLDDALRSIAAGGYGALLRTARTLEEAERAVASTALWNLRILAGWLPPSGTELVRALAGWFELANVDGVVASLVTGAEPPAAYALGGLCTAWPRVAEAGSLGDVRAALADSAWGDPGSEEPAAMRRGLVAAWASRVAGSVPEARAWVAGAGALAVARDLFVAGDGAAGRVRELPGVPRDSLGARSPGDLRRRLTGAAAQALEGVDDAGGLWRAELRWWQAVEADATALAAGTVGERETIVGAVALLLVDARETARALGSAARGGSDGDSAAAPPLATTRPASAPARAR